MYIGREIFFSTLPQFTTLAPMLQTFFSSSLSSRVGVPVQHATARVVGWVFGGGSGGGGRICIVWFPRFERK